MKEHLGYILDGVEFLKPELLYQIEENSEKYHKFGIGVYSDDIFEKIYGRPPIKPYKERAHLANAIKGVDLVWEVTNIDDCQIGELKESPIYVDDGSPKKYHVVYAPGSYDLLHEGHLEHLLECRKLGDILVVGVKSDQNVFETKGKFTRQNEIERINVIKKLYFVDHAFIVTTHNKHWANERVTSLVGSPIDAIVLGSDCKGQELYDNPDGILFLFTTRDPGIAKTRSSTFYRQMIQDTENNG